MRAIVLSAILWIPGVAAAQCAAPYAVDAAIMDLTTVETALRDVDNAAAGAGAKRIKEGIGCLNEVMPVVIAGRLYRAIGSGLYASGDMLGAFDWYATAIELDPSFTYGTEDMGIDHPSRQAYEDAKRETQGDPVVLEGKAFVPSGTHYLDGRKLAVPTARLGRPHLYQWDNGGVKTWLISSNEFPPEVLGAAVVENTKKKKQKNGTKTVDGVVPLKRDRPKSQTPMMVLGAGIIGGAGALYAMSAQSLGDFNAATTQADAEALKTSTNQLFLLSAGVLGLGVGTLGWGVFMDGSTPIPAFGGSF